MPKETNVLDEFLGNVEENNDFAQPEKNPLDVTEKVIENTQEGESEEKKPERIPFAKDPKVQKFIEKELNKRLAEFERKIDKVSEKSENKDEDDFWLRLIGDDKPEKLSFIKEAKVREEKMQQIAEEKAFQRLQAERNREEIEVSQSQEELENSIDEIEEEFNIDLTSNDPIVRKTRQDFLKYVEKIAPKDREGEIIAFPDMLSAFETFNQLRTKTSSNARAKDLASKGVSRQGETATVSNERPTFDNVDDLIKNFIRNGN